MTAAASFTQRETINLIVMLAVAVQAITHKIEQTINPLNTKVSMIITVKIHMSSRIEIRLTIMMKKKKKKNTR